MSRRRIKTEKTVTQEEINKLKMELTAEALDTAFLLMLGLPAMVLHDKYNLIMKKEIDGKGRVERFTELTLDLYDSFVKGYLTIEEIHKVLKEEGGLEIMKTWNKGRGK